MELYKDLVADSSYVNLTSENEARAQRSIFLSPLGRSLNPTSDHTLLLSFPQLATCRHLSILDITLMASLPTACYMSCYFFFRNNPKLQMGVYILSTKEPRFRFQLGLKGSDPKFRNPPAQHVLAQAPFSVVGENPKAETQALSLKLFSLRWGFVQTWLPPAAFCEMGACRPEKFEGSQSFTRSLNGGMHFKL